MASWRAGKKADPLNKRIPENPKYKHIKATVDTGASLSKYLEHLEDIRKNYRFKKDEIFKRLKVTTFVQLVVQVALTAEQDQMLDTPTPQPLDETPPSPDTPPNSARSTLNSIVHGIGELDVSIEEEPPPPSPPTTSPYLLLDVRDKDDYQQCHIVTAKSYPVAMLSRSCNYFTKDILHYANSAGQIIILYDDNERIAPHAATVFVQKGVDNVFLLSGGMKVLYKMFPQGIITGSLPQSCLPTPPLSSRKKHRTPERLPPLHFTPSHPEWPSPEDIEVLQERLDEVLLASEPSSRASSRPAASRTGTSRASTSASMHSKMTSPPASSRGPTPWK